MMPSQSEPTLKIEVTVESSQAALLEGLESWLKLGLISDHQVRQLCRKQLSCRLPEVIATLQRQGLSESADEPMGGVIARQSEITAPLSAVAAIADQELQARALSPVTSSTRLPSRQSRFNRRVTRLMQSLMAELSVIWLLCLGVFLVVVSSAVLAATQWERFTAPGQYLVLWGYTAVIGVVSGWTQRQASLQLTTRTLQLITLLLVPVNFWAMDGLSVGASFPGLLLGAIATITLMLATVWLYHRQLQATRLNLLTLFGLSCLHWGWDWPSGPLWTAYIGTIGSAIPLFYETAWVAPKASVESVKTGISPSGEPASPLRDTILILIYAVGILLVRAIFVDDVNITQLGLALGICGWLLGWLALQHATQNELTRLWGSLGWGFLLFGWLVTVLGRPWQAIAISGLSLWLFKCRLQRFWRRFDLAALFLVGLQMVWLGWRLLPPHIQQSAIATLTQITGAERYPTVLLGVVLFPYVIVMVGAADWLYRRSQATLARFSEGLALGLGVILTLVSMLNPTIRVLNLIPSTLTLWIVTQRQRPLRRKLVYLTHGTGLVALCASIDRLWSNLSLSHWD
ncbi:MAG: DUF2157 domain-containing protein, partial [Cyanothece sp. SIO1E1]|nr:DUF2157 domain-containing protein [Cyanothece sp. SIO1E1]